MSEPKPPAEESNDYFLEIESQFARVRGTTFLFSSKDWALMKQWHTDGVPLAIVLEAIESVFAKKREGGRRRVISSLSYCRHAVEELWSERKDLYVGKAAAVPESDPAHELLRLSEELTHLAAAAPAGAGAVVKAAAARVAAIGARSVPEIEETLLSIEDEMLHEAAAAMPSDQRDSINAAVAAQPGYGATDAAAERMRSANLKRLLRKELGLPRLSLFR